MSNCRIQTDDYSLSQAFIHLWKPEIEREIRLFLVFKFSRLLRIIGRGSYFSALELGSRHQNLLSALRRLEYGPTVPSTKLFTIFADFAYT